LRFFANQPAKPDRDDTIAVRLKRLATMFLRFVTTRIDKNSHKSQGVFAASHALLDSDDLTREEWERLREMIIWFNVNLPSPPKKFDSRRAIFWFKSTAEENIRKVWELVYMLREHGHHVEVQKCRRLGNIVWEDDFQAAAFPSDSDGRISIQ
jgi:hypothetical protein